MGYAFITMGYTLIKDKELLGIRENLESEKEYSKKLLNKMFFVD